MANERRSRRNSIEDAAEAVFKPVPAKIQAPERAAVIPGARELVSLRIDQDVLAHFQEDGAGWQDRLNAALRTGGRPRVIARMIPGVETPEAISDMNRHIGVSRRRRCLPTERCRNGKAHHTRNG